ncbi:TPA: hypothetical protein DDW35_08430, partial [Candidatus Sumerlaeota bacterium]|nr:hypothetical protein [Candidatus Sumerlaeota bacterium]
MKSNEIGKVLCDRFEILDVLGAGGMGVVYKAHDRNMDVDVALKVMRSGSADNDDLRKRLEREGRLMAKLRQHANIVTIYERVIQDGDIHLVMDYINGEDLHKLIQRTLKFREEGAGTIEISSPKPLACLDQTSAITIAIQALNALQFAHTQGILHRDIKPGN